MKTIIRESSIQAYHDIRESGAVGKQCQAILGRLRTGNDYSLQEMVRLIGIPINAISGRCSDLKKMDLLEEAPARKCSITLRTIHPVKLPGVQRGLF